MPDLDRVVSFIKENLCIRYEVGGERGNRRRDREIKPVKSETERAQEPELENTWDGDREESTGDGKESTGDES